MSGEQPPAADLADPAEPFFLIIADYARRIFSIEGPMTDDQPWIAAARRARANEHEERQVVCGPRGTDRAALAAEFAGTEHMRGVPPGSIVRANR